MSMKRFRTFKEIRDILRIFHWTILTMDIFALVAFIIIFLCQISNLWLFIPTTIVIAASIINEFYTEKNYNQEARNKELYERHIAYEKYIADVKITLEKNGINGEQKIQLLKEECIEVLEKHQQKYLSARSRIYDVLIGVPLGALISSLIHQSEETAINQIVYIIVIGIFIICISKIVKQIRFYSDGYFKDKHLLNALNEIQYLE